MFGLGPWLPVGVAVLVLLISTPAMLLAWLKLRRRNLGPILDANGWAINGRARINVAFGAAMTELAILPPGSQRSLDDPFADKRTPWKRWVLFVILIVAASSWYLGKLDVYIPDTVSSLNVLGKHSPAYKREAKLAADKAAADKAAADKAAADKAAADKAAADKAAADKAAADKAAADKAAADAKAKAAAEAAPVTTPTAKP